MVAGKRRKAAPAIGPRASACRRGVTPATRTASPRRLSQRSRTAKTLSPGSPAHGAIAFSKMAHHARTKGPTAYRRRDPLVPAGIGGRHGWQFMPHLSLAASLAGAIPARPNPKGLERIHALGQSFLWQPYRPVAMDGPASPDASRATFARAHGSGGDTH